MRVTATESWIRTVGWNACRRLQCRRRLDLDSQPRPHATGAFLFLSGREVEVALSALGTKRTNRELCYLSAVGAKRTSARQQLVVIEEHPSTSERCCAAPLRFPDAARALRRSAAQDEWCRAVVRTSIASLPAAHRGSGLAIILFEIGVEPFVGTAGVLVNSHRQIHGAGQRVRIAPRRACDFLHLVP